jgi:hypothetical protein
MDKLAQDRGLLNKLREKTNITGKILESLNPEFQEMMDRLRATDEKIRSHADQIKDVVRAAKSHTNRRDYLSAATNISAFHERCRFISAELQKFIKGVNLKHYKFLLDQFDDEQKQALFGYDPNKEINLEEESQAVDDRVIIAALKRYAGLSDWWFKITDPIGDLAHNLSTSRGIAMRQLEKKFSIAFLKELKANTTVMTIRTQRFLSILLSTFKALATALAKRNVDQYVKAAKSFISKFAVYHTQFVKYYTDNIVPLKERHNELLEEAKAEKAAKEEAMKKEEDVPRQAEEDKARKLEEEAAKQREISPPSSYVQTRPGMPGHIPMVTVPGAGKLPTGRIPVPHQGPMKETPEEKMYLGKNLENLLKDEENPFDLTKRKAANFITRIEKFAEIEDHKSLMLEVLAFSETLENSDPETSLKLIAIAEGIAEDYKTAGVFDFFSGKKDEPKKEELRPLV